jgi:hypothetical protein
MLEILVFPDLLLDFVSVAIHVTPRICQLGKTQIRVHFQEFGFGSANALSKTQMGIRVPLMHALPPQTPWRETIPSEVEVPAGDERT